MLIKMYYVQIINMFDIKDVNFPPKYLINNAREQLKDFSTRFKNYLYVWKAKTHVKKWGEFAPTESKSFYGEDRQTDFGTEVSPKINQYTYGNLTVTVSFAINTEKVYPLMKESEYS